MTTEIKQEDVVAAMAEIGLVHWCNDSMKIEGAYLEFVQPEMTYREVDALVTMLKPDMCLLVAKLRTAPTPLVMVDGNPLYGRNPDTVTAEISVKLYWN